MYRQDELLHYGVKGMKWGVRRDLQALANHRRNVEVSKIKNSDILSKGEKKVLIREANVNRKKYLKKVKMDYESNDSELAKRNMVKNIRQQAAAEISSKDLKTGARIANNILTGAQIGANIGATVLATAAVPALGSVALAALAGNTAGAIGRKYLIDMGLDRLD